MISKRDNGVNLSRKEEQRLRSYNTYLGAYATISKRMESQIGSRGNCDNLIPLYENNFEANQNDGMWLDRAMNRLFNKDCSQSELFVKIVEQKNFLEPNATTSYYLGTLKDKAGDADAALEYYNKAIELENDSYRSKRRAAYPSQQEQFDMQYWDQVNGTTKWKDAIAKVKSDNPKPS